MASVYTNDLRLEEIGSGEQSGTWGDTTNTNLELIAEGFSFGTEAITTNADTHTSTVADGATDPARSMYIKYTGTLDSTCTITIAPNTLSRMHFIENGTSGSQDIIISQGSGANVTIPPGDVKAVYLDGAGSGAAVIDAFASLNVGVLSTATADNNPQITLVSTATNASQGPVLDLYRNSSSPADNDLGGAIKFNAENDAGEKTQYQIIQAYMPDVSNGSEDGAFQHYVMKDGTSIQRLEHSPTETVFNQDSADVNFRIESNNQDHLFFVDGGNDGIGIGNSTIIDWSTNYPGLQMGQAGALYGHKSSNQMSFAMNWGVIGGNNYIVDGFAARVLFNTSGEISFDTAASGSAAGDITAISTLDMTATNIIFNEDSHDMDFRVESNNKTHALFVDAGNDHVNIGGSGDLGGMLNVTGDASVQIHSTDRHVMSLVSTEAGASDGPRLVIQRDSSSPADGDQLGILEFYGENDASQPVEYARINASIIDQTDGTEDGALGINTRLGGANANRIYLPPTETIFNEQSYDLDFRVESDGNANMFFVDGTENAVAVGGTTVDRGIFHVNHINNGNFFDDPHIALTFNASPTNNASSSGITYATSDSDNYGYFLGAQRTTGGAGNFILKYHADSAGGTHEVFRADASGNFGIGSLLPSASYKMQVQNATNQINMLNYNSNASFSQDLHAWDTNRAGTDNFNFGRMRSNVGGSPDSEFIFNGAGTASADGSWNGGGADYAEYFEWADGNPSSQDRVGVSVKLDGTKIVASTSSDDPSEIIGVISANPSVVGDTADLKWQSKYERDDYNRYIWEAYTFTEWTVPATETKEAVRHIYPTDYIPSDVTVPSDAVVISKDDDGNNLMRKKLNSSFDKSIIYVPRSDRKEWDTVGLMGKLRMTKGQKTGTNWIKMKDISDTVEEWLVR